MPAGGAKHATPRIHTLSPETAIVILSADETKDDVIQMMSTGAIAYLRKGLDAQTLITKLLVSWQAHHKLGALTARTPA